MYALSNIFMNEIGINNINKIGINSVNEIGINIINEMGINKQKISLYICTNYQIVDLLK